MEMFYVVAVSAGVLAAVAVWWMRLNATAFLAVTLLTVLSTLAVYPAVYFFEKSGKETFYEFWNGYELEAIETSVECVRDGRCSNTYSCDPYTVTRVETYTDSDGNLQSRTVTETHYHSCPYSSQETTWSVNTSLGSYTILKSAMTGEPYRAMKGIPGGQVTSPPEFWVEAKSRIDNGTPSGVTVRKTYKNYILGSDTTIFRQHEADIEEFAAADVLPAPASAVRDFYMADKAYFAGVDILDEKLRSQLMSAVQNLNGRAGVELTADIHVVFADSSLPPDLYTSTLNSYWLSPEIGKNAIAKNAVVVVFGVEPYTAPAVNAEMSSSGDLTPAKPGILPGVNPDTAGSSEGDIEEPLLEEGTPVVSWARAFTGMPVGNETFIQAVTNLKGEPVNVDLLGNPHYDKNAGGYSGEPSGKLESVLFGDSTKYERVSMSADDEGDIGGGFKYLSESYVLSGSGYTVAYSIASVLALAGFGFAFAAAFRYHEYDIIVSRETVEEILSRKKGNK